MAGNQTGNPVRLILVSRETRDRYATARHRKRMQDRKAKIKYRAKLRAARIKNSERPFIFWDGEGPQDAGYALFGSSAGDEICHPFLSTEECLDLLLESRRNNPDAIFIAFGFNYDASMILKDLPWRCLNALRTYGATWWHDYEIEHIPHKWFKVRKDGTTAQVFDIRNFFPGSYVSALVSMQVGNESDLARISSGKAQRSVFQYSEIAEIRSYWKTELKLGPLLAEKLREAFLGAGFDLKSWHGPGALARLALAKHDVFTAMKEAPYDVREAARYAFAGGRFEMPRGGHVKGKIYNADKRSAYPAYARELPNLDKGSWRYGRKFEPGKFGIYHIRYNGRNTDPLYPHPLFRRERNGLVCWPRRVEGWYHAPEAELVSDNPDADFLEAWIFDEASSERPFAWIAEYFERRQLLKRMGNPLELTFKLIINSVYGQLAQRTGWDRKKKKPPRTHQLEWAGYITSACRAAMWKVAVACGDKLISIDTDGVYSMAPIPVIPGPGLGDWELSEYEEGIFWQNGIYALRDEKGWSKGRTRGIPKGSYSTDELLSAIDRDESLFVKVHTFVGYGLALGGQFSRLNTWEDQTRELVFGGMGKRYHNIPFYCAKGKCPGNGIHHFLPQPETSMETPKSETHYLPWLENKPDMASRKLLVGDYVAYNENHLDEDMQWERADYEYANAAS